MNREKLLNEIKKELIREFKNDSYHLERVVPYYILIQKENHPLLLELIKETNNNKFYIDYRYIEEDYYSYGTIAIYFNKYGERCLKKDETYFEVDLNFNTNGSTDEHTPRIVIRKCTESKFIDCYENTSNEYEEWYSELTDLQKQEKENKRKRIDEEIERLLKEKEDLENS